MVPTALPCFHLSPIDTVADKHVQPAHGGSFIGGCARHLPQLLPALGFFFLLFFLAVLGMEPKGLARTRQALHHGATSPAPRFGCLLSAFSCSEEQPQLVTQGHFPCSHLCRAHLPSSTSHPSVYSDIHKAACFQLLGLCLGRPSTENAVHST